jgi:hypothetical protein
MKQPMQKLADRDEVTRRRFLFQGTAAVGTGMGLVAGGAVRGDQSQAPEPSSAYLSRSPAPSARASRQKQANHHRKCLSQVPGKLYGSRL